MIDRFKPPDGVERLREALLRQDVVEHSAVVADALLSIASLAEFQPGKDVIVEGGADSSVHFIVAGEVEVLVKGHRVATRGAGTHVGEMAFIDPSAPRSATVRTTQTTVIATVDERALLEVVNANPHVWRALARELGIRLRQRGSLIRPPNPIPILLLACSAEQLGVAQKLQEVLLHEKVIVQVWTDDVFAPTHSSLEDLIAMVGRADFGVVLMFPDDMTTSREKEAATPRDNVVFELGMLLGALDRERSLIVRPLGATVKYPSDLLGIKPVEFRGDGEASTLGARLGPVVNVIREKVKALGPR